MEPIVTDAVIVRLVDYGEADRIVTLLTRGEGKLAALARGARRSQRRFAGSLALFAVGEASLRRRRGDLWSLESFAAPSLRLGHHLTELAHAAYLSELTRELVPEEAPDETVYRLLSQALERLAGGGGFSPSELRAYELALLDAVGFAPVFDRCVACDAQPNDDAEQLFDAARGGVVCGRCRSLASSLQRTNADAIALPAAVRRGLRQLQRLSSPDDTATEMGPAEATRAREILQALLAQHLPHPLRSLEFIAKLNRSTLDSHG